MNQRQSWIEIAVRLARPVLECGVSGRLKAAMPVEVNPQYHESTFNRANVSHLEAVGRLLCGLAPWLELGEDDSRQWAGKARATIASITDPASPDYLNFTQYENWNESLHSQPLVDAAFLAQAILRAPHELWHKLPCEAQRNVVDAMLETRKVLPAYSNWLLFAAMVEALLHFAGEKWDKMRVDYALRQHEQWFVGDGTYGDGPHFVWDYYNSYVIQPMLVDIAREVANEKLWRDWREKSLTRLKRYAQVQEALISPEGTFPMLGRSSAYRCGALQALAQAALLNHLADNIEPAQVRCALTKVLSRQMLAPATFDANGWLQIGFVGHQPEIAESYISTGSLYLCATALLPLGLPRSHPFWSAPDCDWTQKKIWAGAAP